MLTVITDDKAQNTCFCNITLTDPVDNLFKHVVESLNYESENFELLMETQNEQQINLNEYKGKQIKDIGLNDDESSLKISIKMKQEEEPPTTTQPAATEDYSVLVSEWLDDTHKKQYQKMEYYPLTHTAQLAIANQANNYTCNYVGLVNQAMTCYLNSLLQTLYMTPEFRNALYNWEFDGQNATRSIPFQLQKLFLNLQTSQKSAIETTDLTTSFGWQGSEAWQQHDIQELCRVMFDALEQKFKDTKQANLINDLYEGKMLDYVRCLECGTEKSREDTFLDIPLPVRPFGSETAYNTVEKALRAFVLPETLDGNNQYYCEKCQKKCDAHKGLKFTKFPYLLTLHLKRFDFDYNTMHRIKLNDRIRFPETLNLNPFIQTTTDGEDEKEASVKCDDCSTTDSGSALDDETCQVADTSSSINGQDLNIQEEDEGIDMSIGSGQLETEKGPYIYELFSIMIHSGSASGGHYYAYIKDFTTNLWYCFNDQNVTRITEDDIKKTYGGGTRRGHYSGAYSSSTNAYMLMYRQIDRKRNCTAITADNFPPHIVTLLKQMKEKEEQDRLSKEKENDMVRLLVHCVHPVTGQTQTVKKLMFMVSELGAVVREVYEQLKLEDVVRVEDCRLVAYNKLQDCIECSFDSDEIRLCDITPRVNSYNEWMLEIKPPGMEFQKYKPGGTSMKVYFIDVEHEEIEGPTNVRLNADDTVGDFKRIISKLWNLDSSDSLKVVQENNIYDLRYLEGDDCPMKFDLSTGDHKVFVANILDEDPTKSFPSSKLNKLIETCRHVVNIEVVFPIVNPGTLEALDIPPLDLNQNLDKLDMIGDRPVSNSPNLRTTSPQQVSVCEGFGDQSNSEDSSLSDSDRTLVGDAPGDCLGLLSSSSESPADQHMASPSDPAEDMYNPEVFGQPMVSEDMHWDDDEPVQKETKHYFRLLQRRNINSWDNLSDSDASHVCRVMVDKQMHVEMFKKCLAPMVCVPDEYFKLYVHYQNQNDEVPRHETLKSLKDNEKLVIKLGRVLRSDEYISNIYHLQPEKTEVSTFLFEHIIEAGKTVGAVKKEILCQAKKVHMLNIPHSKCRLRKKNWKIPGKVFLDHQKFVEDIHISSNVELFLQELDDVEKVTSPDQLVVFIRHWHPSTLTLDPPTEVVLDEPTVEELKKQISIVSLIPAEFVEIAHTKCVFPCDTNVLNIHNECSWNAKCTLLKEWPMHVHDDGNLFYFRDSRERLKELSKEEEEELKKKEMAKMGLSYGKKKYAPGRERALKIYVDTSPSKSDDGCVD